MRTDLRCKDRSRNGIYETWVWPVAGPDKLKALTVGIMGKLVERVFGCAVAMYFRWLCNRNLTFASHVATCRVSVRFPSFNLAAEAFVSHGIGLLAYCLTVRQSWPSFREMLHYHNARARICGRLHVSSRSSDYTKA